MTSARVAPGYIGAEGQSVVSVRTRPGSRDAVVRRLAAHGGESIH